MFTKKYKCKVCGQKFKLKKENRYTVDTSNKLFSGIIGTPIIISECFDCPYCGCQNKVNSRVNGITQRGDESSNES